MTFTFSHALDYVFGTALALWIASMLVRVVGESFINTFAHLSVAWKHKWAEAEAEYAEEHDVSTESEEL